MGQPEEKFTPSYPTVDPDPVPDLRADVDCCGNCPGWKRQHPRAPFGQCLPAMRFLGAPMYTTDLTACSLDPVTRAKGANA